MSKRLNFWISVLALAAFAATPLVVAAHACAVAFAPSTSDAQSHACCDGAVSATHNLCDAHCDPQLPLDTAFVPPIAPPAAVLRLKSVEIAPSSQAFDDRALAAAPPPALRYSRLLI